MYRVKVQLDNGDVVEVAVTKLIIEGTGDGDEQIHLTASEEGVIVDVVATCCMNAEMLAANCR